MAQKAMLALYGRNIQYDHPGTEHVGFPTLVSCHFFKCLPPNVNSHDVCVPSRPDTIPLLSSLMSVKQTYFNAKVKSCVIQKPICSIDPFDTQIVTVCATKTVQCDYEQSVFGHVKFDSDFAVDTHLLNYMALFVKFMNYTLNMTWLTVLVKDCEKKLRPRQPHEKKDYYEFHIVMDNFIDLTFIYDCHPDKTFVDPYYKKKIVKLCLDTLLNILLAMPFSEFSNFKTSFIYFVLQFIKWLYKQRSKLKDINVNF